MSEATALDDCEPPYIHPAYVIKVAELLATLWGLPVEEVAAMTTANFERAFGVTLPR